MREFPGENVISFCGCQHVTKDGCISRCELSGQISLKYPEIINAPRVQHFIQDALIRPNVEGTSASHMQWLSTATEHNSSEERQADKLVEKCAEVDWCVHLINILLQGLPEACKRVFGSSPRVAPAFESLRNGVLNCTSKR